MVGRMADKNGHIFSEGGEIIGKAELVPESERAGQKDGPFAGFDKPTVTKDGKVADSHGAIIGRILEGDAKKLYGKSVDVDGDILDSNGNSVGKAERWEEEEKVKSKHPAAGRKVNKKGEVIDENGDLIAKLTDGDLQKCAGNEIEYVFFPHYIHYNTDCCEAPMAMSLTGRATLLAMSLSSKISQILSPNLSRNLKSLRKPKRRSKSESSSNKIRNLLVRWQDVLSNHLTRSSPSSR